MGIEVVDMNAQRELALSPLSVNEKMYEIRERCPNVLCFLDTERRVSCPSCQSCLRSKDILLHSDFTEIGLRCVFP